MLISRRVASLAILTGNALLSHPDPTAAFVQSPQTPRLAFTVTKKLSTAKAAPGITIAAPEEIQTALSNPKTTVVDVRKMDEILESGYLKTPNNQWIHAPCSLEECPLLSVAVESLIRDGSEPVVVYCASGKRANVAKEFLEGKGYKHVLNAGAYPDDMKYLIQK